jgi:ribonuclease P/MRP protein subunit POP3
MSSKEKVSLPVTEESTTPPTSPPSSKPAPSSNKAPPSKPPIYRLENPYAPVKWPKITTETQSSILSLLCELLTPIGEHRAQIQVSKGKRAAKDRTKDEEAESEDKARLKLQESFEPEITKAVTLGLNSTTNALEQRHTTSESLPSSDTQPLAVVFLLHAPQSLHYTHLVLLSKTHTPRIPIIPLYDPTATIRDAPDRQLCATVRLPRLSVIGLRKGAPGAAGIMALVESVPLIQGPGPDRGQKVEWMGVKVSDGKSASFQT